MSSFLDPIALAIIAGLVAAVVIAVAVPQARKGALVAIGLLLIALGAKGIGAAIHDRGRAPLPPKPSRKDRKGERARGEEAARAAEEARREAEEAAPPREDPPELTELERRAREAAERRRS